MRFFIDNDCESNFINGLPYYASGLIEEEYTTKGRCNQSGKDFAVVFIDPWGNVNREWRSVDVIRIIKASEDDFSGLQYAIEQLEEMEE